MNNKTLLWGVIAFLAIQAVAIVCLAVFSIGPAGTFLASLASTTGLLVPILIGVQKSFENGAAQQVTATKVATVDSKVATIDSKVDTVHDLTNHRMDELIAVVKQLSVAQGIAIGREQMGEAPPTPAAPIDLTPDVDADYA